METILRHTVSTICGFVMAVILTSPAWGQDSLSQYHPLGKGNIWIYQISHPWGNNYFERHEVTGDSTIDGKQYRIITVTSTLGPISQTSVERYDTLTGCYYTRSGNKDILQDSTFTSTPNASFGGNINNRLFKSLSTEIVLGTRRTTREITEGNIIKEDVISWSYAYGLGLVAASDLQLANYIPSWWQTLVYARIDGIEYGNNPFAAVFVYPLHVGNQWAFHGLTSMNPVSSLEILKDTTMANGVTYSMVRYGTSSEIEFQRYHADSVFIYDPSRQAEALKYRFDAQEKDTIATYPYGQTFTDVVLIDTSITTVFGKRLRTFTFSIKPRGTIDAERWITIADSIGVIDVVQGAGYESIIEGVLISGVGYGTLLTDIQKESPIIPRGVILDQNYPNPFNPSTTISFTIPSRSRVSLKIYDVTGRELATLVSEEMPAGNYSRHWNASGVSSGMYFYRLQAGSYEETKRLLFIK